MASSFVTDKAKTIGLTVTAGLLCLGFLLGLCWFLRPEKSESEKRELTKFPKFTMDSFLSGEYTDQISVWYADTFPGREGMIKAYHGIQSLFGIRGEQFQQGDVGDAVPDGPMQDLPAPEQPSDTSDTPVGGTVEDGEKVGGYYLSGDTAYELYSFSDANARTYASLMNRAAEVTAGKAKVYDLIVPLHYSFALSGNLQKSMSLPDAERVISYMYSGMNGEVQTVDVYAALKTHADEYIYFRTDHHWTATGAYYAYEAFCREAGITPTPLGAYEKMEFRGFLGTLYSKTGQPAAMDSHPDVVEAYIPKGTNNHRIFDADGENPTRYSGGVVRTDTDRFYAAAASKYNCFLMGDHPLIEIHNENIAADRKGTTVLLVKESFGNAFAPFLVDSYESVYVVDYRYYNGTLSELVAEYAVDDVIFLNNVVAATGGARLAEMEEFVG